MRNFGYGAHTAALTAVLTAALTGAMEHSSGGSTGTTGLEACGLDRCVFLAVHGREDGSMGRGSPEWQQHLQRVLPPHALQGLRTALLLVPSRAQRLAADKAWTRAQRQLAGQQAEQQAEQQGMQEGRGGGKKQHQGQAAAVVGVQIAVAGRPSLSGGCAGADLVLLSAVCAPPAASASTRALPAVWPPSRSLLGLLVLLLMIRAALSTPARVLIILGHEGTLSSDSATWRRVIGHTKAHSRFFDAERLGEALRRAVRARRAAVDEMAQMLGEATEFASGGAVGSVSGGSMQWHDLLWTGLFSPSFGEALERHESAEVLLLLCRILQGRQGRRGENGGKALHRWLEGGGRGAGRGREDELSRQLGDIVHVDVVGDLCLIWSTDVCHETLKQVVRLWALVPESQCRPWLHRISAHLTCYSPAYLHYCALHQYTCSSSPRLRVPAAVQQPGIHWWRPPSGDAGDAATPPKFIALQPAMALALLAQGSGALSGALSHVPFEVNAEERAAVTCPSSLVLHGRSGTGKTTVILHRVLHLDRLFRLSALPPHLLLGLPSPANASITAQGDGVGDDVGDGSGGGLRQVVLTRSLHLCASIQTELVKAARAIAALDAFQAGSPPPLPQAGQHAHGAQAAVATAGQRVGSRSGTGSNSGSGSSSGGRLLMREDLESALMGGLPLCIAAIPPTAFPLALTLSKLLRLLDASVSRPFLHSTRRRRRQEEARQRLVLAIGVSGRGVRQAWEEGQVEGAWSGRVEKDRWEAKGGSAKGGSARGEWRREGEGLGGGECSRSGRGRDGWGGWREQRVKGGKGKEAEEEGEGEEGEGEEDVEVDYERFRRHYWAHLDKRATNRAVMDAAFVWREISSHIKGSLQAMQSLQGHVGEEEYVGGMVGSNERTSGMRGADRQAVYDVFRAYERRKRRQGEYDCADLVGYLHREVRRMRASNEPWWAVEDGVAVGGASSSGASRDGASRRTTVGCTTTGSVPSQPSHAPQPSGCVGAVFDCVAVDEVQDLTQAQLALLPLLCSNVASGFVLAGDTAQSIAHGVDFRFEDLARVVYSEFLNKGDECGRVGGERGDSMVGKGGQQIWERGEGRKERSRKGQSKISNPSSSSRSSSSSSNAASHQLVKSLPTFQLVRNYRTHNGVLRLANSVVQLLKSFFPLSIDRLHEELSTVEGCKPVLAAVSSSWKHQLAQGRPLSATQAIIVRSAEEKRAMAGHFKVKPVVLTVEECKGLEFEDVLLFNFFTSPHSTAPWHLVYTYMRSTGLSPRFGASLPCRCSTKGHSSCSLCTLDDLRHWSLCSELKQLYVAITRAKQRLWVLEERGAGERTPMGDLWAAMGIVAVKEEREVCPEYVKRVSSEKDWKALGFTFFQRGDYEAARASFERAGDTGNARFAEATMFYEAGIGCTAQPSAAAIAVSTSSASSASSALPPVLPDLSLLSCTDLLLAAARCFEGIKRGLEAGRAYAKAGCNEEAGKGCFTYAWGGEARAYLTLCQPPDHANAARCFEKLGRFAEASDCYNALGDRPSALAACLRGSIFAKGLSLLDSWQAVASHQATSAPASHGASESSSASAGPRSGDLSHLRHWYVEECARRLGERGSYGEMMAYVHLLPGLPAKRAFLEGERHLRELAGLEEQEGEVRRVPGILLRAGMLLEACTHLWNRGWPGRALVAFVRHLQWRVNAAGLGAWRVGMRREAGGGSEGQGRGVALSREEVAMARRLRVIETESLEFADRMECEGSDLAWAKVEMSVLLFVIELHSDAADAADAADGADNADDSAAAASVAAGGDGGISGKAGCPDRRVSEATDQGAGSAAMCASCVELGRAKSAEREARVSQAWMLVSRGQMLPAGRMEIGPQSAAVNSRAIGPQSAAVNSGESRFRGVERQMVVNELSKAELIEVEELWEGGDVLRKGSEQVWRERRAESSGMEQRDSRGGEQKGRVEWKGAEQLRAELMLAYTGLQESLCLLQWGQRCLLHYLEEHFSAEPHSNCPRREPAAHTSQPAANATAAATASTAALTFESTQKPAANATAAATASTAALASRAVTISAAAAAALQACNLPAPSLSLLHHKAALWWWRWARRLASLLPALHHLHNHSMLKSDSHLPHLHALFSLLSTTTFHRRILSSSSPSCQIDDMGLAWARGEKAERLSSTGRSGKMEGKQAVKAVKGVWEKEFEKRLEDTRRVVFDGVQLCSSALISCSDKVTMATCKHHMATASEPPLSLHQTPFPCPSLLSPVHTLFFLSEPFLSLLPVTTLSCSRSAFFQPCSLTPTHNLLTSLLLHPSPSSTHSRLHARLHLTLLHLKAALAALLLLPDNRLEKRKSREKQAASAEEGSGGAGGVGGSGSRGGCGGSCGEGEGKAGVGCENGVGVAWTAHGAAVGNTAGQRVVGAVLHGACMEETAGLSEKEAWGITQLLLVSTVNSFPDPRNPPYFKQQFGSLKGNPLMATSVNGFFESLSTRALLYQQASNMWNVHGDAGRQVPAICLASLLPPSPPPSPPLALPCPPLSAPFYAAPPNPPPRSFICDLQPPGTFCCPPRSAPLSAAPCLTCWCNGKGG
ncbi:unnamed protein product [Closterium sp. NIES-64]|nr:unnamed protein product [Closterium sp. NIES-64]